MAEISTTETKRVNVKLDTHWGTFNKSYVKGKTKDILTIKFSYDVLKKKFSRFVFHRTKTGNWLGIDDLKKLRIFYKLIGETIEEAEKLQNDR